MQLEFITLLRDATEPIDRILNAVYVFVQYIFSINSLGTVREESWMRMLVNTIINSPYLLVTVSLIICGLVIGLLKRLITE